MDPTKPILGKYSAIQIYMVIATTEIDPIITMIIRGMHTTKKNPVEALQIYHTLN